MTNPPAQDAFAGIGNFFARQGSLVVASVPAILLFLAEPSLLRLALAWFIGVGGGWLFGGLLLPWNRPRALSLLGALAWITGSTFTDALAKRWEASASNTFFAGLRFYLIVGAVGGPILTIPFLAGDTSSRLVMLAAGAGGGVTMLATYYAFRRHIHGST
jgi:hypothetical protein